MTREQVWQLVQENMKGYFIRIVLALIFTALVGLMPLRFVSAITQGQINAEVQIVCPDSYGNWFSGSGTIIDQKGIILTNKHVVTDVKGGIINTCFVGFVESINSEPNFGTSTNLNLAEVKYYTTTTDLDAAILYLNNPTNKIYPSVDIWNSDSSALKFGDKLEVIGFPSIGGSTITYTSGDFSGFGDKLNGTQNYIKSTAALEHGNSGGAAYSSAGQFIGVPTMVVSGTLNSLSYILSVSSIKNWLSGILGNNYQQEVIKQEPIIEKSTVNIQDDITSPDISKINVQFYDCSKFYPEKDTQGNVQHYPTKDGIKGDASTTLNPADCIPIPYDIDKSFNYQPQTLYVRFIMPADIGTDIYTMNWLWGDELQIDPLKKAFEHKTTAPGTAYIALRDYNGFFRPFPFLGNVDKGVYYFSLQVADKAGNVSDTRIWQYNYRLSKGNTIDSTFTQKQLGKILLQVESKGEAWYVNSIDGKRYYMKDGATAYQMMRNFGLGITNANLAKIPQEGETKLYPKSLNNLKGKILLQVEANGEAWYVNPKTGYRYYMKDGEAAYNLMRYHSLGISNKDLEKIPEGNL